LEIRFIVCKDFVWSTIDHWRQAEFIKIAIVKTRQISKAIAAEREEQHGKITK
jgi:hypothetical protein